MTLRQACDKLKRMDDLVDKLNEYLASSEEWNRTDEDIQCVHDYLMEYKKLLSRREIYM